jgi:hypothetical protein
MSPENIYAIIEPVLSTLANNFLSLQSGLPGMSDGDYFDVGLTIWPMRITTVQNFVIRVKGFNDSTDAWHQSSLLDKPLEDESTERTWNLKDSFFVWEKPFIYAKAWLEPETSSQNYRQAIQRFAARLCRAINFDSSSSGGLAGLSYLREFPLMMLIIVPDTQCKAISSTSSTAPRTTLRRISRREPARGLLLRRSLRESAVMTSCPHFGGTMERGWMFDQTCELLFVLSGDGFLTLWIGGRRQ